MIKKYTIITVLFVGILLVFALSSSWAQGFLKTSEERALEQHDREMRACKKTERPLECLIQKDQERETERRKNMTPEERRQSEEGEQRIMAEWKEIQRLVEEERMRPIPTPSPELTRESIRSDPRRFPDLEKIQEGGDELVRTVLKYSFLSMNYWPTVLDGKPISVSAGLSQTDPLQGVVVMGGEGVSSIKEYPTPSKTGPVKIVSANGETGIIELVSLAGEWEQADPNQPGTGAMLSGKVFTPGGTHYTFNVRTRKFQ